MSQYEVEVKVLLGTPANATQFLDSLQKKDSSLHQTHYEKQLNHYFINGDFTALLGNLQPYLTDEDYHKLFDIIHVSGKHSVRTRYTDNRSILVVKVSLDSASSTHSTIRRECEIDFPALPETQLDGVLLNSGFAFQAKWSRERDEYQL